MDFEKEILQLLKDKYEAATGRVMQTDTSMQSSQAEFYFRDLSDNLIEPMGERVRREFGSGSGNELDGKMRALRSSSAMTFNMFGNHDAIINNDKFFVAGKYSVCFEKKLPTISRGLANLDVFLQGDTEYIFCEVKMLEWLLNQPGKLKQSYLEKTRYLVQESHAAFIECLDRIVDRSLLSPEEYKSIFRQYDAFQMFKHTLAIYNYVFANKGNIPEKICLVNCVWELGGTDKLSDESKVKYIDMLHLEHEEFSAFHDATLPIRKLFFDLGYDFNIMYMNLADFISNFQKTEDELKYMGRYL